MRNDLLSALGRVPNRRIASRKGSFVIAVSPNGTSISMYEIAKATEAGIVIKVREGNRILANREGEAPKGTEHAIPYNETVLVSKGGHLYVGENAKDRVYFFQNSEEPAV